MGASELARGVLYDIYRYALNFDNERGPPLFIYASPLEIYFDDTSNKLYLSLSYSPEVSEVINKKRIMRVLDVESEGTKYLLPSYDVFSKEYIGNKTIDKFKGTSYYSEIVYYIRGRLGEIILNMVVEGFIYYLYHQIYGELIEHTNPYSSLIATSYRYTYYIRYDNRNKFEEIDCFDCLMLDKDNNTYLPIIGEAKTGRGLCLNHIYNKMKRITGALKVVEDSENIYNPGTLFMLVAPPSSLMKYYDVMGKRPEKIYWYNEIYKNTIISFVDRMKELNTYVVVLPIFLEYLGNDKNKNIELIDIAHTIFDSLLHIYL